MPHTKVTVLATHTVSSEYSDGKQSGTVTTVVKVQRYNNYQSCRRLEVGVKLKMGTECQAEEVGYIVAWYVDKAVQPAKGKALWTAELLKHDATDLTKELGFITQMLFTQAGQPRAKLKDLRDQLASSNIIFIDTVFVEAQYRGTGLAQLAMQSFHSLIPQIIGQAPESEQSNAMAVLSPAASNSVKFDNGKTPVQVEKSLIRFYGQSGYEVWIQGAEEVEGSVTVMGRSL